MWQKDIRKILRQDLKNNWLLIKDYRLLLSYLDSVTNADEFQNFKALKFCLNFEAVYVKMEQALVKSIYRFKIDSIRELSFEEKIKYVNYAKFSLQKFKLGTTYQLLQKNTVSLDDFSKALKNIDRFRKKKYNTIKNHITAEQRIKTEKRDPLKYDFINIILLNSHRYKYFKILNDHLNSYIYSKKDLKEHCYIIDLLCRQSITLTKLVKQSGIECEGQGIIRATKKSFAI